jgi:polysaccharide deacetylase 2 family uncharacterized protein YibQ
MKKLPLRRRPATRRSRPWPIIAGVSGGALLLACGLWLATGLLAPPPASLSKRPPVPPPFEEPRPRPALDHELLAIDEALFAGLREAGVDPQKIAVSLQIAPEAELTAFKVSLDQRIRPAEVRKKLERRLSATKGTGIWRKTPAGLELLVRLKGQATHRVSLLLPPPRLQKPPILPLPKPSRTQVALVIDDLGYQMEPVRRLMALHLPLTLSVLPHSPYAAQIASLAAQQGQPVMVHLPMEPKSYPQLKPGPGALLTSMSPEKLAQTTREDLASVPGAVGANNHMGSKFTEDQKALTPVLLELKARGLFFLDSLTSPRSKAYDLARRLGLAAARRDIFLDHDHTPQAVKHTLTRLISLRPCCQGVIVIGHPHQATLEALEAFKGRLTANTEMVKVSALLKSTPGTTNLVEAQRTEKRP